MSINRRDFSIGVCALSFTNLVKANPSLLPSSKFDTPNYELSYLIKLVNPKGSVLTEQKLWSYLPMGFNTVSDEISINEDFKIVKDDIGHSILQLEFESFAPWMTKIIYVNIKKEYFMSNQLLPVYLQNLSKDNLVQGQISRIYSMIDTKHAKSFVIKLYDWAVKNIRYSGYQSGEKSIEDIIESKSGDCTEYANLIVFFCRKRKIPARMMGGYFLRKFNSRLDPRDYHNWAEVYFDNQWHIVDAQKKKLFPNVSHYLPFKIYGYDDNPLDNYTRYKLSGSLEVSFND